MTREEERRALIEKAAELSQVIEQTEAKLKTAPRTGPMAQMTETMERLMTELRRMEKNLQSMIRISEEQEAEGGTENGSY